MQIILNYIWLLPLAIAAISNAIMDNIEHHWFDSIFNDTKKHDPQFWNPSMSWRNKYIDGDYFKDHKKFKIWRWEFNTFDFASDAWHLFKSLMIVMQAVALMLSAMYYQPIYTYLEAIVIYGLVWNGTFNLFYNKILKR